MSYPKRGLGGPKNGRFLSHRTWVVISVGGVAGTDERALGLAQQRFDLLGALMGALYALGRCSTLQVDECGQAVLYVRASVSRRSFAVLACDRGDGWMYLWDRVGARAGDPAAVARLVAGVER